MSLKRSLSSGPAESPLDSSNFAKKWRQIRACARCHRLKMKCSYDDPSFVSCKRCYAAGVECSPDHDPTSKFKISRPRKKHKIVNIPDFKQLSIYINRLQTTNNIISVNNRAKNNNEKKIDKDTEKLQASIVEDVSGLRNVKLQLSNFISQIDNLINQKEILLRHTDVTSNGSDQDTLTNETDSVKSPALNRTDSGASETAGPVLPPSIITPQNLPIIPFEKNLIQEIIKLKYLTLDVIREKFQYFKDHMLIYWPAIKLPDFYTVDYLIRSKPLLLLTFIVNSCVTSNDLLLYNILSYYLDINLSHKVFIGGNLSTDIIQCYLVLSLWNPPPKKWGTFKHQLHLLTSLNLSLVVDLSAKCEQLLFDPDRFPDGRGHSFYDHDIIRLYLMIYSSCGSLGLSLPKFKSVVWSSNHHLACNYLYNKFISSSRNDGKDRTDIFIYYMSRLVCIGQDIMKDIGNSSSRMEELNNNPEAIKKLVTGYEDRLFKLMLDYRLTDPNSQSHENPLVGLTYQQIMMSMYDHLIYKDLSSFMIFFIDSFFNREVFDKETNSSYKLYKLSVKVLEKLIIVCRKLVDTFLALADRTLNIPTFFNYRPMNAIISLVKAKILIKLLIFEFEYKADISENINNDGRKQLINNELINDISTLDFNLKSFFNHFYKKYEGYSKSSNTFEKMFSIVKKLKKLIKLVGSILNKKNPRNKATTMISSSNSGNSAVKTEDKNAVVNEELIAGFNFRQSGANSNNIVDRQENNLTITSNLANNDLINLLYELGREKAVENIGIFELNEQARKKRKRTFRTRNMKKLEKAEIGNESSGEDLNAAQETPGVGGTTAFPENENENENANDEEEEENGHAPSMAKSTASGYQVSSFLKELFSNNAFSDIVNDVSLDKVYDFASNFGPQQPKALDNNYYLSPSTVSMDNVTIPMPVGVDSTEDNTNLLEKGGSINQFLSASGEELFNFNYLNPPNNAYTEPTNIDDARLAASQRVVPSASFASTIDDYNDQFWANKSNEHGSSANEFNFI